MGAIIGQFLLRVVGAIIAIFIVLWIIGTLGNTGKSALSQWSWANPLGAIKLPSFSQPTVASSADEAARAQLEEQLARQRAESAKADAVAAHTAESLKLAALLKQPRFGDEVRVAVYSYAAGLTTSIAAKVAISENGNDESVIDVPAGSAYTFPALRGARYEITTMDSAGNRASKTFTFTGGVKEVDLKVP